MQEDPSKEGEKMNREHGWSGEGQNKAEHRINY